VDDGNRPFLCSCENIYIEGRNAFINDISVVGTAFLQLHTAVSKANFREICSLLPSNTFAKKAVDYVQLKQRAIIVFALTLIAGREPTFLRPQEIGETVTVTEAQTFLNLQKARMAKYLASKSVSTAIERFEKVTKLRLRTLANRLFL
jgi:hypothetical protein